MFASLSLYLPLWVHLANFALYSIWSIGWEELDQIHNAEGSSGDGQLAESSSSTSSTSFVDANLSSETISDDDLEPSVPPRSSHSRKKQDGHIRRPPNAFLIFRSEVWNTIKNDSQYHERNNRDISCIAGDAWRELPDDERDEYRRLAAEAKEKHKKMYPHYKFCPVAKGKGGKRRSNEDVQARNLRAKAVARRLLQSRMAKAESDAVDDGGERGGDDDEPEMSYDNRGGLPAQKKGKKSSKGKARAAQRRYETPEPPSPPSPLYKIEPFSPGLSSLPALSSPSSQNSSPPSSPELRERSPVLSEYGLFDEAKPSGIADSQVRARLIFRCSYAEGATQSMPGLPSISGDDPFARPEPTPILDGLYPLSKDPSSPFNFSPVVGSTTLVNIDEHVPLIDLYGADVASYDSEAWWGNTYDITSDGLFSF